MTTKQKTIAISLAFLALAIAVINAATRPPSECAIQPGEKFQVRSTVAVREVAAAAPVELLIPSGAIVFANEPSSLPNDAIVTVTYQSRIVEIDKQLLLGYPIVERRCQPNP
jgi:hypothetical protein